MQNLDTGQCSKNSYRTNTSLVKQETFVENGFTAIRPRVYHNNNNTFKMNSRPVSIRNIESSRVTFVPGTAKAGRNPGINFKYDGQNLQLLIPRVAFPAGVLIRDGDSGNTTYTLMGSLGDQVDKYKKEPALESAGEMGKLYNFLTELDERIIHAAVENSVKWFGKKRSEEAIRDSYKPIVSVSVDKVNGEYIPNGKYPPSFRVKVPVYDSKVSTEIVDASRNPVYATPESLLNIFTKRIEASVVLSGSIYVIAGGSFGVTWRLNMAQVFPRAKLTAQNVFDDVDDRVEDGDTQEATPVPDTPTPAPAPAPAPVVEQSETVLDVEIPDTPDEQPLLSRPAPRKRKAAGAL